MLLNLSGPSGLAPLGTFLKNKMLRDDFTGFYLNLLNDVENRRRKTALELSAYTLFWVVSSFWNWLGLVGGSRLRRYFWCQGRAYPERAEVQSISFFHWHRGELNVETRTKKWVQRLPPAPWQQESIEPFIQKTCLLLWEFAEPVSEFVDARCWQSNCVLAFISNRLEGANKICQVRIFVIKEYKISVPSCEQFMDLYQLWNGLRGNTPPEAAMWPQYTLVK